MKTTSVIALSVTALGALLFLSSLIIDVNYNFNLFIATLLLGISLLGLGLVTFVVSADLFGLHKAWKEYSDVQRKYHVAYPWRKPCGLFGNLWARRLLTIMAAIAIGPLFYYVSRKFNISFNLLLFAWLAISLVLVKIASRKIKVKLKQDLRKKPN